MIYTIIAIMAGSLVGGCAHDFTATKFPARQHIAAPIAKSAAPIAATPNAIVKKRWYQHFPHHPKFFH